jgi:hypothetical protein
MLLQVVHADLSRVGFLDVEAVHHHICWDARWHLRYRDKSCMLSFAWWPSAIIFHLPNDLSELEQSQIAVATFVPTLPVSARP